MFAKVSDKFHHRRQASNTKSNPPSPVAQTASLARQQPPTPPAQPPAQSPPQQQQTPPAAPQGNSIPAQPSSTSPPPPQSQAAMDTTSPMEGIEGYVELHPASIHQEQHAHVQAARSRIGCRVASSSIATEQHDAPSYEWAISFASAARGQPYDEHRDGGRFKPFHPA